MNGKKKNLEVTPPGFEPAPQLPSAKNVPLNLFEPCGAVFIMNSKIHVRKNSLNDYSKRFRIISLFIQSQALYGPLDERTDLLLRCSR